MRLSTVFELLLIFLFIAFAASRSVDKKHHHHKHHGLSKSRQAPNTKPGSAAPNRYCQCTSLQCNCCRDFSLPVVSLKGPGCANVQYMNGDSMRLTMSFGDRVLRNITLSGKKPRPVCMGLPGADTKFCGRIYGIQRVGDQFKACLALEMRSLDEIEAALRVSCFKFGPDGVKLEPGRPVPGTDDYDDDDDYGFDEDDDDDDDDDDFLADDDDDEENDVDSGDYTGFSALGDEFLDGFFGSGPSKKKKKTVSTTATPVKITKRPTIPAATTLKAQAQGQSSTTLAPSHLQNTTPGKSKNGSEPVVMEEINDTTTASSMVVTSTEFSVKVVQDGNTIEESTSNNVPAQGMMENTSQNVTAEGSESDKVNSTTQSSKFSVDTKDEDEDEEEDEEEQDEDEDEEGSSDGGLIENPKEKQELLQSKDDDENILDGILGSDDDDDEDDDDDDDNNSNKEEDGDDDDDEDEFRQLRSHVLRGPYHPMTLEDQERQFPGLSALIKPPSVPFMSLQEQERRFPGLSALIRPPPVQLEQSEIAFDFPPVRSARNHRRMRLPPV